MKNRVDPGTGTFDGHWPPGALPEPELKPFSVLLLYPDYLSDNYGEETYYAHVTALNADDAIKVAQTEAAKANTAEGEEFDIRDAQSFAPLLVIEGHHTQPAWG